MRGEAEAFAIEAKAAAEAEQMAKKADAWKEYREAAVVDMVLATMPKVTSTYSTSHFILWCTVFQGAVGLLFVDSLGQVGFEPQRWK